MRGGGNHKKLKPKQNTDTPKLLFYQKSYIICNSVAPGYTFFYLRGWNVEPGFVASCLRGHQLPAIARGGGSSCSPTSTASRYALTWPHREHRQARNGEHGRRLHGGAASVEPTHADPSTGDHWCPDRPDTPSGNRLDHRRRLRAFGTSRAPVRCRTQPLEKVFELHLITLKTHGSPQGDVALRASPFSFLVRSNGIIDRYDTLQKHR